MNISIISAKVGIIAAAVVLAFASVFVANAAVTITNATLSETSVATGASVTLTTTVNKTNTSGNETPECTNNWNTTRVTVTGDGYEEVYTDVVNLTSGTGPDSDSYVFTAPTTAGQYTILVEVFGGPEASLPDCPADLWDTETLSLDVYAPVAPFINVNSISPENEIRTVGDTNPVVYEAEVEIGGVPTSAAIQCVVFDIFRGDAWNTTTAVFSAAGTYDAEDGIFFSYDVSTYATGTYQVVAIALDAACDALPDGFDSADYLDSEDSNVAQTTLTIVDPVVRCDNENANNFGQPGECTFDEVALFKIFGYVWNDVDEDGSEITEPEEGENGLGGIVVTITNGDIEFTTETDSNGYYEFNVPAGTWTITDGDVDGYEQTYPINDGNVHVVTVPEVFVPVEPEEGEGLVSMLLNWLIPTAYAQTPGYGPYNFGNVEEDDNSRSSSRSSGTRVGDRDRSSSSDRDDSSSSDDTPAGQVLGEATSVMPVGAPNTGKGGSAPVNAQLPTMFAILGTARGGKKSN